LAGIQEILTLILLITCIIFLPRLFGGNRPPSAGKKIKTISSASGKLRLAIVVSVLLPLVMVAIFPPWHPENQILFFLGGVLPVIIYWAGVWILQGFRKK